MALARPQPLQDRDRGEPVRNQAQPRLEIAHRGARLEPKPPTRLADVEPIAGKLLLQFQPLGAGEHALLARPGLCDRSATTQTAGEKPDRESVGLGRRAL